MISSDVGVTKCGRNTALFRSLGSRHSLTDPLGFVTHTKELTQDVGFVTGVIISWATRESSSALNFSFKAIGTRRGECITGGIDGSILMLYSPGRHPMPLNMSENSLSMRFLSFMSPSGFACVAAVESVWSCSTVLVPIVKLRVTSPSFLEVWRPSSAGPLLFTTWKLALVNLLPYLTPT